MSGKILSLKYPGSLFLTKTFYNLFLLFQSRGSRAVFQLYPENSEQVKGGKKPFVFPWRLCVSRGTAWRFLFTHLPPSSFLSKAWADNNTGHEGRFQWRHGGGLPQQRKSKKVSIYWKWLLFILTSATDSFLIGCEIGSRVLTTQG